jgi:MFS family permease
VGCLTPLYAFSLFLPTIIQGLGHSGTRAQLLTVPPYACAAVLTVVVGLLADRTRWRGLCNIGTVVIGMVGFIMLLASSNLDVQYAGVFLGAMGIYPTISNTLSWCSNNTEGALKRAFTLGMVVGWGNLNGVVSCNIYLQHEKPRYWTGHAVVLAYLTVFLLGGSVFMHFALKRENKLRISGKRDNMHDGLSDDEKWIMGDKRPDFIYTT